MATFVIYWSQDVPEPQDSPIDPYLLVEFEDQTKAINHLKAEGYMKYRKSILYFTSLHHVKTFAKILESRKAEKPNRSKYSPDTITH